MNNAAKKQWLCEWAWSGLSIQAENTVRPCCRFQNTFAIEMNQKPENSQGMQRVRRQMLQGIPPEECSRCIEDEAAQLVSKRQRSLRKFLAQDLTEEALIIKKMEFSLGNLCNSRCVMCNPELSTAWNIDAQSVGYQKSKLIVPDILKLEPYVDSLEELQLIGGETLLGDSLKKVLELCVKKNAAKNIHLKFITNLTIFPQKEVLDLLEKFKKVEIYFSVDGFEHVNNWIRYPSRWQEVEKNARSFFAWKKSHIFLALNYTASAHSFSSLGNLLLWWEKIVKENSSQSLEESFWLNTLLEPSFLAVNVLPLENRKIIWSELTAHFDREIFRKVKEAENFFLSAHNEKHLIALRDYTNKFQYRSAVSTQELFPELFSLREFELQRTPSRTNNKIAEALQ